MIRSLRLERFKRFRDLTIPCASLTVLTGGNGAGKTSVIHALMLARQAATEPQRQFLQLNDWDALQLGEAAELIHRASGSDAFDDFAITVTESDTYRWTMQVPAEDRFLNVRLAEKPTGYMGHCHGLFLASRTCVPSVWVHEICSEQARWNSTSLVRAYEVNTPPRSWQAGIVIGFRRTGA